MVQELSLSSGYFERVSGERGGTIPNRNLEIRYGICETSGTVARNGVPTSRYPVHNSELVACEAQE